MVKRESDLVMTVMCILLIAFILFVTTVLIICAVK